jgi:hypothetical protein
MGTGFTQGSLSRRKSWITMAVFVGLAVVLVHVNGGLEQRARKLKKEYEMDIALAKHGDQFGVAYRRILSSSAEPQGRKLDQNDWIRKTQELVSGENLSLRDLTPVTEKGKKGKRETHLTLTLDAPVIDLMGFLSRLHDEKNWVHVKRMTLSSLPDRKDQVQVQMTLSQKD